jgi:hypothetical protein
MMSYKSFFSANALPTWKKRPEFGPFGKLYMMNFREVIIKNSSHKELMQIIQMVASIQVRERIVSTQTIQQ